MFWPSLISWSALTLSGVRCELLKQSRLTFFKSQSEIHDGIGRSSRSPVWKHRVSFSRFTLDHYRGQYSAYQLLSSTLTFTDVLIGIDLVRGKMWPSEPITFWLSSKSIENRTESGGTYHLDLPRCQLGLIMLSLALMLSDVWSARTFVRRKKCLSNLQLIHSHLFSSTSCWAFPPAQLSKKNVLPYLHPICEMQFWHSGRDACNYTTDWYNFSIDMGFYSCCQKDLPSFSSDDYPFPSLVAFEFGAGEDVRSFLFKKFAPVTRSSNSMMETTRVSFRTLSSCLPLPAISHFPFNIGSIFLSTPCHYSLNHIVSVFKVPTSHLLVKKQSHWCF